MPIVNMSKSTYLIFDLFISRDVYIYATYYAFLLYIFYSQFHWHDRASSERATFQPPRYEIRYRQTRCYWRLLLAGWWWWLQLRTAASLPAQQLAFPSLFSLLLRERLPLIMIDDEYATPLRWWRYSHALSRACMLPSLPVRATHVRLMPLTAAVKIVSTSAGGHWYFRNYFRYALPRV